MRMNRSRGGPEKVEAGLAPPSPCGLEEALIFSKFAALTKRKWRALGESNPSCKIENLES
jgi:hypothetical protein